MSDHGASSPCIAVLVLIPTRARVPVHALLLARPVVALSLAVVDPSIIFVRRSSPVVVRMRVVRHKIRARLGGEVKRLRALRVDARDGPVVAIEISFPVGDDFREPTVRSTAEYLYD